MENVKFNMFMHLGVMISKYGSGKSAAIKANHAREKNWSCTEGYVNSSDHRAVFTTMALPIKREENTNSTAWLWDN